MKNQSKKEISNDERERMIAEIMEASNATRSEAAFICAIELGEIDGDIIELQPGQNIDDILEK